jgi:hypothetical protein
MKIKELEGEHAARPDSEVESVKIVMMEAKGDAVFYSKI